MGRTITVVPRGGTAGAISGLNFDTDKDCGGKTLFHLNLGTDVTLGGVPMAQAMPIGFKWDRLSSSPTLARVDANGNVLSSIPFGSFDNHVIWNSLRRCVIDPATGDPTYGLNARGDGLDLTGEDGPVMVECPLVYVKAWRDYSEGVKDDVYVVFSPYPIAGFEPWPDFWQRGGTLADFVYWGAYPGTLKDDAGTLKMDSRTGEQPWTGYGGAPADGMFALGFDAGIVGQAPGIGDTVTGAGGSTGVIVAYHLTSGAWETSDAAGILYLKQTSAAFTNDEALSIGGVQFATANTPAGNAGISLTLGQAEAYANAVNSAAPWGNTNIWKWTLRQMLMYVEYGTLDIQSALGKGISDMSSGTGFAGKEIGVDDIESRLAPNGTGTGSGTNGLTPICWRGTYLPYSGEWEFVGGCNAIDAEWRFLPKTGLAALMVPATLSGTEGTDYEATEAAPLTYADPGSPDGYVKKTLWENVCKYLFLPSELGGSSSTYLADYHYQHRAGQTNILLGGGSWSAGTRCGPGCLNASCAASSSHRDIRGRLEFRRKITSS